MRGQLSLAASVLRTLSSHPSTVLQRLTQACLDILSSVPRSNSPSYAYESAFTAALRAWRAKLTAQLARLDLDMDDFQEEIEAMEQENGADTTDEDMAACSEERFSWQAGFNAFLKILSGDVASIIDAVEYDGGWKSALSAWCLYVRPGLKRDDLPWADLHESEDIAEFLSGQRCNQSHLAYRPIKRSSPKQCLWP